MVRCYFIDGPMKGKRYNCKHKYVHVPQCKPPKKYATMDEPFYFNEFGRIIYFNEDCNLKINSVCYERIRPRILSCETRKSEKRSIRQGKEG